MCPTELIRWKNQKGSTCYLMTFYKRDSTSDIFLEFSKNFRTSHFTRQLQTTDCKGFLQGCARAALAAYGNRRNTATVLRAVVKSHKGLKRTKVHNCLRVFWKKSKKILKIHRESPRWSTFIVKLQPGIALSKKSQSKIHLVNFIKKETPIQRLLQKHFPVSFEKILDTTLTPLRECL